MIVILYFDNKYFKWSGPFLKSLQTHEPKAKVVIFGFNLTEKQETQLENTESVIEVINTAGEINFWNLVCQKCYFVLEVMRKYPGEDLYIVMDIDTLIISPLDELKRDMVRHDIGLIVVSKTKVPSGFLVFKETAKGFLSDYHNEVYVKGTLSVKKIEQKILAKLYRNNKKLKFLILSRDYIDNHFKLDSFIWSAHKLNLGVKDMKIKLFTYVSNGMAVGATKDWRKYLRNWKKKVGLKVRKVEENRKSRKRAKAKKALGGKK
jgi:hypothetical protein